MFPAESLESFRNRVSNNINKTTKHNNFFAQLQPLDRATYGHRFTTQSGNNKLAEVLKQERAEILLDLLT